MALALFSYSLSIWWIDASASTTLPPAYAFRPRRASTRLLQTPNPLTLDGLVACTLYLVFKEPDLLPKVSATCTAFRGTFQGYYPHPTPSSPFFVRRREFGGTGLGVRRLLRRYRDRSSTAGLAPVWRTYEGYDRYTDGVNPCRYESENYRVFLCEPRTTAPRSPAQDSAVPSHP